MQTLSLSAALCRVTTSITWADSLKNDTARKILIIVFWLLLWQGASALVHNSILLAGPYESLLALCSLAVTSKFWLSILFTFLKITLGFVLGLITGILCACLSYRFKLFREFITPPISVIKSIPVASFVIIVIIWAGASSLATVISALVVFPMIYHNMLSGLESTGSSLIEMGRLFRFRFIDKARYIYFPQVLSHLHSAVLISSGMAFKSGIAAEVIGRPLQSIGNGLYLSKISLATADLFAWTFCAVILAYLFEKAVSLILKRLSAA